MSSYQPAAPIEDVNRGTVVALLALPVGVIVWVLVWTLGFIASIITLGVAYLAMFLYRLGSGGVMGRGGAVRVSIITIVTLVAAIIAGLVADVAVGIGTVMSVSPIEALGYPVFGEVFTAYVTDPESNLLFSLGLAIVFGLLGCFGVLRSAFQSTAADAVVPEAPRYPSLATPGSDQPGAYQPGAYQPMNGQQPPQQQPADGQALGQPIPGVPQFPSQLQQPAPGQPVPGVQYPNPPGYEAPQQQLPPTEPGAQPHTPRL